MPKVISLKSLFVVFVFILVAFVNPAQAVILDIVPPGGTLYPDFGPDPWGGRGFVFQAQKDFSMSSLGMEMDFNGPLGFAVDVYGVNGTTRSSLLSSTAYASMMDNSPDGFFTLNHSQAFSQGQSYEVMMRYLNSGPYIPHYEFDNPSLNPAQGFQVGDELLVLDGTDYNGGLYNNYWFANFQLTTYSDPNPIPEPPSMLLMGAGLVGLVGLSRRRTLK